MADERVPWEVCFYGNDGSAEGSANIQVVMATSRDGLSWSAPKLCSPPDPDQRYVDFVPGVFLDHDARRVYVSWTSNRVEISAGSNHMFPMEVDTKTTERRRSDITFRLALIAKIAGLELEWT